jgi:hypothetical protein
MSMICGTLESPMQGFQGAQKQLEKSSTCRHPRSTKPDSGRSQPSGIDGLRVAALKALGSPMSTSGTLPNVTITLEEEVARWARAWAAKHDTSGLPLLSCRVLLDRFS